MNVKENAENVIITRSVGQARDAKFVSVFTVLREMDGAVKVFVFNTRRFFLIYKYRLVSFNTFLVI